MQDLTQTGERVIIAQRNSMGYGDPLDLRGDVQRFRILATHRSIDIDRE